MIPTNSETSVTGVILQAYWSVELQVSGACEVGAISPSLQSRRIRFNVGMVRHLY